MNRRNRTRRVKDLARDAATRNRTKINRPTIMFGNSEMVSLTILAPVFHAIEKSTGITPPRELDHLRASPVAKLSKFDTRMGEHGAAAVPLNSLFGNRTLDPIDQTAGK